MRRLWCALPALAVIACASPRPSNPVSAVKFGSLHGAQKPAVIQSRLIYEEIPEYRKILDLKLGPGDPQYYILLSQTKDKFDDIIRAVADELLLDGIAEKGTVPFERRVPDVTFHALRIAIQKYSSGEVARAKLAMIDLIVQRETEIGALVEQVESRNRQIADLNARVAQLDASHLRLQQEVTQAQARVAALEGQLANANKQAQDAAAARDSLSSQAAAVKAELDRKVQELAALAAQSRQLQAERDSLAARTRELESQLAALKGDLDKKVQDLAAQVADAQAKLGSIEQTKAAAEKQAEEAATKLQAAEQARAAAEQRVAELQKRVQALESERQAHIARLQQEARELNARLAAVQDVLKKFAQNKPNDVEVAAVRNQLSDLELMIRILNSEIARVGSLDSETQTQARKLAESIEALKQELSKFAQ